MKLGGQPLPSALSLIVDSWRFVWGNKRILLGLGAMYAVTAYIIVGGISQLDFVELRVATQEFFSGEISALASATSLLGAAMSGALTEPANEVQRLLSSVLVFIFWLAIVWATRMIIAGKSIKIRDALYNCCAPIIPSLLLFGGVLVQALPAILATFGFALAENSGLLKGGAETMVIALAVAVSWLLSTYWIMGTIFSLVIVTLPQMYPWKALVASGELIVGQRWQLALRIAAMLIVVLIGWGVILLPALLLDGWLRFPWLPLIPIVVQTLMAFTLVYTSVFLYKTYRSLL